MIKTADSIVIASNQRERGNLTGGVELLKNENCKMQNDRNQRTNETNLSREM